MNVATKDQTKAAIEAVKAGMASKDQKEIAKRAGQQAGEMGNRSRDAFQGR